MIRIGAFSFAIFGIFLCSCTSNKVKENITTTATTSKDYKPTFIVDEPKAIAPEVTDSVIPAEEYADYFVVVVDTGFNYAALRTQMLKISNELGLPIDTLGRTFDQKKNLIALPEDDEDELYAGDYFPRRNPGENLSLEYLDFYQKSAVEKRIAILSGIYEHKKSADSALKILKRIAPKAFSLKAKIFMGCMH